MKIVFLSHISYTISPQYIMQSPEVIEVSDESLAMFSPRDICAAVLLYIQKLTIYCNTFSKIQNQSIPALYIE